MTAVQERPWRIAEVIEAILKTWDSETDHVKRVTLKVLSTTVRNCLGIAEECVEVTFRGSPVSDVSASDLYTPPSASQMQLRGKD